MCDSTRVDVWFLCSGLQVIAQDLGSNGHHSSWFWWRVWGRILRRFWRKMWRIWCPWNLFQQSYHLSALGKQIRNSTKTSVKDVISLSSEKSDKPQAIGKLDDARWGWDRRLAPRRSRSARRTDAQISIKYLSWNHQEKCEFHYVFTAYSFWIFFVELILPVLLQIVYFYIGCTSRQLELKVTAQ